MKTGRSWFEYCLRIASNLDRKSRDERSMSNGWDEEDGNGVTGRNLHFSAESYSFGLFPYDTTKRET